MASAVISVLVLFASEARIYGIKDVGFIAGIVGTYSAEVLVGFEDFAFGTHCIAQNYKSSCQPILVGRTRGGECLGCGQGLIIHLMVEVVLCQVYGGFRTIDIGGVFGQF